jgi:hypothetical protein
MRGDLLVQPRVDDHCNSFCYKSPASALEAGLFSGSFIFQKLGFEEKAGLRRSS